MSEESVYAFLEWLKDRDDLLNQMRTMRAQEIVDIAKDHHFHFTAAELVSIIRERLDAMESR
ncbi:hypothetical protein JCM16814_05650 [Desulfobaculum senezii]|jgi:hypothetical protein